jgi:hypothetical protein
MTTNDRELRAVSKMTKLGPCIRTSLSAARLLALLTTSLGVLIPTRLDFAREFAEACYDGTWSAADIKNMFCLLVMEGGILLGRARYTCRNGETGAVRYDM